MPRSARSSAASTHALQIAAAPSPAVLTTSGDENAGRQALERVNAAVQQLKAIAVQPLLQKAVAALEAEDPRAASEWALKVLEQDDRSGFGWCLLAMARERAGDFVSSLQAYESALQLMPDHVEIANDLGRLAMRMGMAEQAEKFFRLFARGRPDNPDGPNNLASALRLQGRRAEAIEVLKPAIQQSPSNALLWNSLGAVLAEDGDHATAEIFFTEAIRLDPRFFKARYNLANALVDRGAVAEGLTHLDAVLPAAKAEDDRQMMRLARATTLLAVGRLAEGWDEYEARLHPQFADTVHFAIDRPRWSPGDDLAGKSLLVIGEQGLGDEILFGNVLPDVIDRLGPAGKLTIAVEPRLIPLFARSFPDATVGGHHTLLHGGR